MNQKETILSSGKVKVIVLVQGPDNRTQTKTV